MRVTCPACETSESAECPQCGTRTLSQAAESATSIEFGDALTAGNRESCPSKESSFRGGETQHFEQALVLYMRRVDNGEDVDREHFIAQHPAAAQDLRAYFETADVFRDVAQRRTHDADFTTRQAPPRQFGEYELLAEIARGGMGVVYRAHHAKLDRIVAVKMILAGRQAARADIERFYTEARAAANLDHAGIVPIYEVGEIEGQPFYSMAFVNGQSLADRVAAGPLPPGESATFVMKIAQAVEYAHQQGVVHRDLKPANVILTPAGQPRVTDFGLAKQIETAAGLTVSGQILGTPGYLPPEQAEGRNDDVGPRSDVYSLGAILYTLLTGRPPFQSATPIETLRQVVDQQPVSPRALNSAIPLDLQTITLKCLEKEAAARYGSAKEVVEELGRFLLGDPIHARPSGPFRRSWRYIRRNRTLTALAAVTTLLVLTSLIQTKTAKETQGLLRHQQALATAETKRADAQTQLAQSAHSRQQRAERERRKSQQETQQALETLKSRDAAARDQIASAEMKAEQQRISIAAERNAIEQAKVDRKNALRAAQWAEYERSVLNAHRELNLGHRERAAAILAACPPAMRSWEWTHLQSQCRGAPAGPRYQPTQRDILSQGSPITAIAVWPSGIQDCRAPTADQRAQSPSEPGPTRILASTNADGTVTVVDWSTGRVRFSTAPGARELRAVAIDASGSLVAAGGGGPTIHVWDWERQEKLLELRGAAGGTHSLAFHDSLIAAGGADGSIRFWHLDGSALKVMRGHRAPVHRLKFGHLLGTSNRPAGELLLASLDAAGRLLLWNSRGGQITCKRRDDQVICADIACGPGSLAGLYLSEGADGAVKRYPFGLEDTFRREWRSLAPAVPSPGPHGTVKLIRKSLGQAATIRYAGTKIVKGRPQRTQISATGTRFAISPLGRWLATEDGSAVVVHDTQSNDAWLRFEGHAGTITSLAWAPDSSQLFSGGADGTVRVWDISGERESHGKTVTALALNGRQHRVAIASADRTIRVWDTTSRQLVGTLRGHTAEVSAMALLAGGERLATVSVDGKVRIWKTDEGRCQRTRWIGISQARCAAFSTDGSQLATVGDKQIAMWDIDTARAKWRVNHSDAATCLTYGSDGCLAVGFEDDSVRVYDADTGSLLSCISGDGNQTTSVSFSNDSRLLAWGDAQGGIFVWDTLKGVAVSEGRLEEEPIRGICFSADDQRILIASGNAIKVWNLATSRVVLSLPSASPANCLAIDEGLLVSADINGQLRFWQEGVRR